MDETIRVTSKNKAFWGMTHLNGNLLCAIDVSTTGLDPLLHEIVEICILPVDRDFNIHKEFPLFNMRMRPERPAEIDWTNCKLTKATIAQIGTQSLDKYRVADLLWDWYQKLKLAPGKQIWPLAQNWVFDRSFIVDWLGHEMFHNIFSPMFRDTFAVAQYLNDRAAVVHEPVPFPKSGLGSLCRHYGVEQIQAHSATSDALAAAQVYKRMLQGIT